ncbi:rCG63252 [Rattus norvegicus]|uniref:RCG63252 n=1 Tax=Rattus norvegicus TaxID=10116 RepID=A6JHE2_RAT|nr:rCG63252 [Rattus norvegicus]
MQCLHRPEEGARSLGTGIRNCWSAGNLSQIGWKGGAGSVLFPALPSSSQWAIFPATTLF